MTWARWSLLALALLLALPVPAWGADLGVAQVDVDLFLRVDTTRMTLHDECGGSVVADSEGRGFTYAERDAAGTDLLFPPGYTMSGCGYARVGLDLPEGAESLHVSYFADRRIESFADGSTQESIQGIQVTDLDTGGRIYDKDVYPRTDLSREDRRHDTGAIPLPSSLRSVSLEFYFQDLPPLGNTTGNLVGEYLSGRSFSATVHDIEVVVHGDLALDASARIDSAREGTILLDAIQVRMEVPATSGMFQTVPRVQVPPSHDFERVRLPNGDIIDEALTWNGSLAGPPAVLVERTDDGLQVRLNPALLALGGSGEYVVVTHTTQNVRVSPVLLPFAVLLLVTPLPFAVLAIVQARGFHKEAFGAYRRAARNLMIGVVGVFVYYLAVLVSAFVAGRLDLMGVWPLPLEGVLLYVQVAAAGLAFVLLWLAARALYWITRPRPGTARDGKEP